MTFLAVCLGLVVLALLLLETRPKAGRPGRMARGDTRASRLALRDANRAAHIAKRASLEARRAAKSARLAARRRR